MSWVQFSISYYGGQVRSEHGLTFDLTVSAQWWWCYGRVKFSHVWPYVRPTWEFQHKGKEIPIVQVQRRE